jgi:NAD(P)-dependent dehydrogenase (short-subunit alcohol dehydrogenase family)
VASAAADAPASTVGGEVVDLREDPAAEATVEEDALRPLVGKVAVVTGGGGAVGRAVALALLDAGARVCVLDREAAGLRETTAAAGPAAPILYLQCDLGSVSEVAGAADFITRFDRPVDVLVHAADVHVAHGVGEGVVADLDEQYLVNLRGPYLITQQLLERLQEGPGHVVFINPGSGATESGDTQYAMTRAGVGALADGTRRELRGTGVRVSTIHVDAVLDGGSPTPSAEGFVSEVDIADCVMGALEMPARVEISELHLRPRAIA